MICVLLGKGVLLGFSIAAPIGPVGTLCINRVLRFGRMAGIMGGLGTACADGIYAGLAAFGIVAVGTSLGMLSRWLALVGGIYLLYLAYISLGESRGPDENDSTNERGMMSTFLATMVITLANPATILSFGAIFAGLGLAGTTSNVAACTLVGGVFLGSLLWWVILSMFVGALRERSPQGFELIVRRISSAALGLFGVAGLYAGLT